MYEVLETDVLVIGGGGAGCRAAIEAHDQGASVFLLVKGGFGNSGCTLNVGTSAAVGPWAEAGDSHMTSLRDLLAHGGFLGNQALARILVEESVDRVLEMERWGIDFERDADGRIVINRSAAHTHPRNFAFKPRAPSHHDYGALPGIAMMDVLMGEVSRRGIRVLDEAVLVDLMTRDGRVVGATALDCRKTEPVVFKARAVILATGTYSQVFSHTTVSPHETGDGQAAAYRVGTELIDMESTQFVATAVGYPPGTVFRNANGDSFLGRYGISGVVGVTKEELCLAVGTEIAEGRGTANDGIMVDMTGVSRGGPAAAALMDRIEAKLKTTGSPALDPRHKPFETFPLAHTTTGGVRINERCESSVAGLYAAGAAAGGVYGHARPEGYTSMITLVFGRRAGLFAAQDLIDTDGGAPDKGAVQASLDRATMLIERAGGVKPREVKAQIQAAMKKHAWVIKNKEGLDSGLRALGEIGEIQRVRASQSTFRARPRDGYEWATALEVPNLLLCAELMLKGSLLRKESRGAFFRRDFPGTDNKNWLKNIIYRQVDGMLVMDAVPVDLKYCGPGSTA